MTSFDLEDALKKYKDQHETEADKADRFLDFFRSHKDLSFSRRNEFGHFTGSAWLLHPKEPKVLLTHHKKLNLWIQLGGHADGESDLLKVAMTEAEEESGIKHITPIMDEIFDLDCHRIPERKNEPEHWHFDIRFLLKAHSDRFHVSPESYDLKWISIDDKTFWNQAEDSLQRMYQKWRGLSYLVYDSSHHQPAVTQTNSP